MLFIWSVFGTLSDSSLHKKWGFPLRISSANADLVIFAKEILNGKHFLCSGCDYWIFSLKKAASQGTQILFPLIFLFFFLFLDFPNFSKVNFSNECIDRLLKFLKSLNCFWIFLVLGIPLRKTFFRCGF